MVETKKLSAYCWWFDSRDNNNNNITTNSPWLQSTLSELDEKTECMLNLIEQEADSFAKRAEMYYKKRPELIKLIEDQYRTHRALALHYDHQATKFEFDSTTRLLTRHKTSHLITDADKSYDSYSDSFDLYHDQDSNDSVINEHHIRNDESLSEELMSLREEIIRLKEENKIQKKMLVEKDEEKREAIRQLSLCVDSMKQENLNIKKMFASKMQVNRSSFFSRVFWEKMFF